MKSIILKMSSSFFGWFLLIVTPVNAVVLTFNFSGTIYDSKGSVEGLVVSDGDIINGVLSYDDAILDSDPDPSRGEYHQALNGGLQFFINGSTIEVGIFQIWVLDNYQILNEFFDIFQIENFSEVTLNGNPVALNFMRGSIQFVGGEPNTFTNDSLPNPSIVTNWPFNKYGSIFGYHANRDSFSFSFDEITFQNPIPEPSSILLLGIGMLGVMGFRRRI